MVVSLTLSQLQMLSSTQTPQENSGVKGTVNHSWSLQMNLYVQCLQIYLPYYTRIYPCKYNEDYYETSTSRPACSRACDYFRPATPEEKKKKETLMLVFLN